MSIVKQKSVTLKLIQIYLDGRLGSSISKKEVHGLLYLFQEMVSHISLGWVKHDDELYIIGVDDILASMYKYVKIDDDIITINSCLTEFDLPESQVRTMKELIRGYESPLGIQLLVMTHWVMHYDDASRRFGIVSGMEFWQKAPAFTSRQVIAARDRIISLTSTREKRVLEELAALDDLLAVLPEDDDPLSATCVNRASLVRRRSEVVSWLEKLPL